MRNIAEIYKKELRFYFTTPIAFIVMFVFAAIFGFLFFRNLTYYSNLSYQMMQNPYYAQRIDLCVFTGVQLEQPDPFNGHTSDFYEIVCRRKENRDDRAVIYLSVKRF